MIYLVRRIAQMVYDDESYKSIQTVEGFYNDKTAARARMREIRSDDRRVHNSAIAHNESGWDWKHKRERLGKLILLDLPESTTNVFVLEWEVDYSNKPYYVTDFEHLSWGICLRAKVGETIFAARHLAEQFITNLINGIEGRLNEGYDRSRGEELEYLKSYRIQEYPVKGVR